MASKKTNTTVKEEVVKAEAIAAEVKEDAVKEAVVEAEVKENAVKEAEAEVEAIAPYNYIPLELRNKLETVAGKMLDQLANYKGEYNANQLNSINTAMEIYRTIRY